MQYAICAQLVHYVRKRVFLTPFPFFFSLFGRVSEDSQAESENERDICSPTVCQLAD